MNIKESAFRAQCLRLLGQVSRTGEEFVILKRCRPVARLVPAGEEQPWLALRGRGVCIGHAFSVVVKEADIEALR